MIPDLTGVQIKTRHISKNIYMIEATGDVAGNIGASVGPDGILLVDTQFAPLAKQICNTLRDIGGKEIQYIVNTHSHEDHTHGNAALGENATLIVHNQVWKQLKHDPTRALTNVVTFDDRKSLYFNGERVDIVHFPNGHTVSDSIVIFNDSNVVHVGDLLNSGCLCFPFVDLDLGGSIEGLANNLESILSTIPHDAKIIPGHYDITDIEGLQMTYGMLLETIGIVQKKIAQGKNLEQIKAEGFPAKYDSWGGGYSEAPQWIENIYSGSSPSRSD
jgi:cyclase